jgi:hypothetical protein
MRIEPPDSSDIVKIENTTQTSRSRFLISNVTGHQLGFCARPVAGYACAAGRLSFVVLASQRLHRAPRNPGGRYNDGPVAHRQYLGPDLAEIFGTTEVTSGVVPRYLWRYPLR